MSPDLDPRQAQRRAADPSASVFVTANAGSGKTTTLVDRVARLLLARAAPEAILCVTYTKAAAAEMQRRLFDRLGAWSVMEDAPLSLVLAELRGHGHAPADDTDLSKARALFAQALETPGGLKIQTIHAFCEKLLKRFPLEARVSPGFKVMDDHDAAGIAHAARAEVADLAMSGASRLADAYARLSIALAFDDFQSMFGAFEARRAAIAAYIDRCDGAVEADIWRRCGFEQQTSAAEIEAEAVAGLDADLWRAGAEALRAGTATDGKCADKMLAALASGEVVQLLAALFTADGAGTAAKWVENAKVLQANPALRAALLLEQDRLAAVREDLRAARIAEDTVHALILAHAYIGAYDRAKQADGALDFADLILKTHDLLTRRADAAWVLYKLDGGIDHILLDEAQDTAPEQWAILRALTGEFFVGAGVTRLRSVLERTLFIVGDEKQSIYSFQGADPDRLRVETRRYHEDILAVGRPAAMVPLLTSFRSTPQVLGFVDTVFCDRDVWRGVPPPSGQAAVRHLAQRIGEDGCVDLWDPIQEVKDPERDAWDEPLDVESTHSANRVLAEKIAGEIKALVERGDAVHDKSGWRAAHFGDVLILVRRRKALFEEIIRALKRRNVPVAGADRLSLSAHIVFDDLMALARFLQFPGDDLALAALLKAPFLSLDEEALFALAHKREGTLWAQLNARAGQRPQWGAALAFLQRCQAEARARRPFDFFSRLLGFADAQGRSVRAGILTRLGSEAEEVLDEFLAQVLSAERAGITDLERLTQAFADLDITVKRELEGARGEVRVMTVHGAKGLEAPIVFLPETTLTRTAGGSRLLSTPPTDEDEGGFLWAGSKETDCEASRQARQWRTDREEQETQRLFYVALTRARDRLVLCGRIGSRDKPDKIAGWYGAARTALDHPDIAAHVRPIDVNGLAARRFGPDPQTRPRQARTAAANIDLPAWLTEPVAPESVERFASPSRLGEEAHDAGSAPSPLAATGGLGRYRRGDLIHRLLQLLPDFPAAAREDAAARLLARETGLTDAQRAEIAAAALGVLNDAQFAAVFGPGSRAEAAIAGRAPGLGPTGAISGRVDRLLVQADRVLVVDFKTNRPSPDRIEDADPAYLRQMAVYAAVLQSIFPERRIEAALVWTDGPKLMPVPENLRARVLAQLSGSVDS